MLYNVFYSRGVKQVTVYGRVITDADTMRRITGLKSLTHFAVVMSKVMDEEKACKYYERGIQVFYRTADGQMNPLTPSGYFGSHASCRELFFRQLPYPLPNVEWYVNI